MFSVSLKIFFDLNGVAGLFAYTLNVLLDSCNHSGFLFKTSIKHDFFTLFGGAVAKGLNMW